MNEERWETADQIQGALDRFVADVPGYRMPAVYAVGMVDDTGVAAFPHVNRGDHPLPARRQRPRVATVLLPGAVDGVAEQNVDQQERGVGDDVGGRR